MIQVNHNIDNPFLITNLALKSNILSLNFIIREAQFSFGKDSAQITKVLMNHTLERKSPHSNILYFLNWGSKLSLSNTTICLVKPFSSLRKDLPSIIGEAVT